jgi:hypothetical protein
VLNASTSIILLNFLLLFVRIFHFLLRSEGADNATFILYNHQPPPTHQQPTYQQPTHLQQNFTLLQITIGHCQMKYKMPYQQCHLFKVRLGRQQKNLDLCTKNSFYLKPVEYVRQIQTCYSVL